MAYSDKVIEHYNNPRNVGSFAKDEPGVGTGVVGAPECGDVMKLQLKISDNGVIEDARFKTFGCGSAIASSSYVTELVKGKHIDEAMTIKNTVIVKELNLPPVKIHCSVLAEDAIKAAITDWRKRKGATDGAAEEPRSKVARRLSVSWLMISLSESAAQKIKQLVADKREGAGLRVKVVGGGCSGLQYRMEIDAAKERDKVFERDGARLIVDKKSFLYLNGSELDYGEELMASGFKVVNPNAKRSCGCGESFVV